MGLFIRLLIVAPAVFAAGCATCRPVPLVSEVGLGHLLHPIEEPEHVECPPGGVTPAQQDRVHVFAINGLNPLCLGNFNGMCNYFRDQGFTNTHFGQFYTYFWFADAIHEIKARDPEAKIVLIGFSSGATNAKWLANRLDRDGVPVDLLVYLVGDFVWNTPASRPPNVRRIVNIRGRGLILLGGLVDGEDIDGARNERVDCRHILAPSRPEMLKLLTEELLALAASPPTAADR
ncbi:MAG TPA: hypothetical protein VM597_37265 [Gemmataceae bacterium]|jgi:hypothetical protein|nr:hypothetical protein [Gemmataceae bacterium]